MSFEKYMSAGSQLWMEQHIEETAAKALPASVVVTTESREVMNELEMFDKNTTMHGRVPFPVTVITNQHDVMQGTGFLDDVADNSSLDRDKIMLSAISSLKAQLATRVTVGNCCSNFHLLIADLLSEGCGAASENTFQCLRICCAWDKSQACNRSYQ